MPIDANVYTNERTAQLSRAMTSRQNQDALPVAWTDMTADPNFSRAPDFHIFFFNISHVEHHASCPPCFPDIALRACPPEKPWELVYAIPNVVNEKWVDSASGEIRGKGTDGRYFATNLLNPANTSGNQWNSAEDWSDAGGMDLTRRGVFWSMGKEPRSEELQKARERLIKHYQRMIRQADDYASRQQLDFINLEHHAAADYLKVRATWHTAVEVPEDCPNCGGSIKKGAAFHPAEGGGICVIDWQRTINAGVKKLNDVPRIFRSEAWYIEALGAEAVQPDAQYETRSCLHCGTSFPVKNYNQKFCKPECREAATREKASPGEA